MRPITVLLSGLLILAVASVIWFAFGSSEASTPGDSPSPKICTRCSELDNKLRRKDSEISVLKDRLREWQTQRPVEIVAASQSDVDPRLADASARLTELSRQLGDALAENFRLNSERTVLADQLTALLNERAEGLLQRYLQSHQAGEPAQLDRMREYLARVYRLGLNPDLVQVEKLHRVVAELAPQIERAPTAFPEGYNPEWYQWQMPQFNLIDWRHEQQVRLADSLQQRVAEALAVQTTLLFPEEEE